MSVVHMKVRAAIEAFLDSNWTTTSVRWSNTQLDTSSLAAYITATILPVSAFQNVLGQSGGERRDWLLVFQVFTPADTGAGANETIVDELETLFNKRTIEEATVGNIEFGVPFKHEVGETEGWFQLNLQVPFYLQS